MDAHQFSKVGLSARVSNPVVRIRKGAGPVQVFQSVMISCGGVYAGISLLTFYPRPFPKPFPVFCIKTKFKAVVKNLPLGSKRIIGRWPNLSAFTMGQTRRVEKAFVKKRPLESPLAP